MTQREWAALKAMFYERSGKMKRWLSDVLTVWCILAPTLLATFAVLLPLWLAALCALGSLLATLLVITAAKAAWRGGIWLAKASNRGIIKARGDRIYRPDDDLRLVAKKLPPTS